MKSLLQAFMARIDAFFDWLDPPKLHDINGGTRVDPLQGVQSLDTTQGVE